MSSVAAENDMPTREATFVERLVTAGLVVAEKNEGETEMKERSSGSSVESIFYGNKGSYILDSHQQDDKNTAKDRKTEIFVYIDRNHQHPQRKVIFKIFPLEDQPESELKRIESELILTKKASEKSHKNIIGFIEALDIDQIEIAMVLEYCEFEASMQPTKMENGFDQYRNLKRGGTYTEAKAIEIICGVLQGLKHLHEELRIHHRDIKPENIFISKDGTPKIGDFGVSQQISPDQDHIEYYREGTPEFIPLEVVKNLGEGKYHPFSGDIYALAGTFFILVHGRVWFRRADGPSDCIAFEEEKKKKKSMNLFRSSRRVNVKSIEKTEVQKIIEKMFSFEDYTHRPSASELLENDFKTLMKHRKI